MADPHGTASGPSKPLSKPLSKTWTFFAGGWHEGNVAYREKFGDWSLILERYEFVAST